MHISRLRLLGFKSFVEPTELTVERGLTGVVGPNGCGKSNLLEALRWVMGETSHKSMRAAAMDDVIFAGTTKRPPRNWAEVTLFIDNTKRTAPAAFNDRDVIEITRRIEREAGSAYRINGTDARARDVKVLFEDAATGARSPALVRQGQISEIVNAKPEQRRRILEDAAGIAGLHTRRHEAELRMKAAEGNLARIGDVLGGLNGQIESLKRQARHAKRYKELSADIRRAEALLFHLSWADAQADVAAKEGELGSAMATLGLAVESEARAVVSEAAAAERLPGLREAEAVRGAVLARLKIEQENFEREARRAEAQEADLKNRAAQLAADHERETDQLAEGRDALERLEGEHSELIETEAGAVARADALAAVLTAAEAELKASEAELAALTRMAFERRARRQSLEAGLAERREQAARLQRQLAQIEQQSREVGLRAPDAVKLADMRSAARELAGALEEGALSLETAEDRVIACQRADRSARELREAKRLALGTLKAERDTLAKLLGPIGDGAHDPVVDHVEVAAGYEAALGAALGDDLEASLASDAPLSWRLIESQRSDGRLPDGATPLAGHVTVPPELSRRLAQVGLVDRANGQALQARLKPGQRLVSREGDLWRWDGFVARADAPSAAAQRLIERNRLTDIDRRLGLAETEAVTADAAGTRASAELAVAEGEVRRLRQLVRDTQAQLARTREALAAIESAVRETETRLAQLAEQRDDAREAMADAVLRVDEAEAALATLAEAQDQDSDMAALDARVTAARTATFQTRAEASGLARERDTVRQRIASTAADLDRWRSRVAGAEQQARRLAERLEATRTELTTARADPEALAEKRSRLNDALSMAEAERAGAADALAATENELRAVQTTLRAAQAAVGAGREARARIEAHLESARARRADEARRIREQLEVTPDACLALAGLEPGATPPPLADVDRQLTRLKSDRERLGGVNLAAESELDGLTAQFTALDRERADVENAIAKLRGGIGQLNREGRRRLMDAFTTVNGHFQRLFTTLFGGGEARLEMIESEDPLEGGLEIIAKPPGKKPATLSLLSGGEQTLTALSLIFAVFLTNPSPICVLDEVDAPLDDSNVDRFCTLMEHMAKDTETRFLVITHHPMTMARMNRLFGVTMGEKGVSQLVSVDLTIAAGFRETG